jgi:hypothetical protein
MALILGFYNALNDFGLARNPESGVGLTEISRSLIEATKQRGAKLAMFLFPVRMQVVAKDSLLDTSPQKTFKRMCKELSIPCFDLLPRLRAAAAQGMTDSKLFYDHCHYKKQGNEIIAQAVGTWLLNDKLVQK